MKTLKPKDNMNWMRKGRTGQDCFYSPSCVAFTYATCNSPCCQQQTNPAHCLATTSLTHIRWCWAKSRRSAFLQKQKDCYCSLKPKCYFYGIQCSRVDVLQEATKKFFSRYWSNTWNSDFAILNLAVKEFEVWIFLSKICRQENGIKSRILLGKRMSGFLLAVTAQESDSWIGCSKGGWFTSLEAGNAFPCPTQKKLAGACVGVN